MREREPQRRRAARRPPELRTHLSLGGPLALDLAGQGLRRARLGRVQRLGALLSRRGRRLGGSQLCLGLRELAGGSLQLPPLGGGDCRSSSSRRAAQRRCQPGKGSRRVGTCKEKGLRSERGQGSSAAAAKVPKPTYLAQDHTPDQRAMQSQPPAGVHPEPRGEGDARRWSALHEGAWWRAHCGMWPCCSLTPAALPTLNTDSACPFGSETLLGKGAVQKRLYISGREHG